MISTGSRPIADLVPDRTRSVVFGTLKDQLRYDDVVFEVDADIQRMFYGDRDLVSRRSGGRETDA